MRHMLLTGVYDPFKIMAEEGKVHNVTYMFMQGHTQGGKDFNLVLDLKKKQMYYQQGNGKSGSGYSNGTWLLGKRVNTSGRNIDQTLVAELIDKYNLSDPNTIQFLWENYEFYMNTSGWLSRSDGSVGLDTSKLRSEGKLILVLNVSWSTAHSGLAGSIYIRPRQGDPNKELTLLSRKPSGIVYTQYKKD